MLVRRLKGGDRRSRRSQPVLIFQAVALASLLTSGIVLLACVPLLLFAHAFGATIGHGIAGVVQAIMEEWLRFAEAIRA